MKISSSRTGLACAALAALMSVLAQAQTVAADADGLRPDNPAEPAPEIGNSRLIEYACELDNKVQVYEQPGEPGHIVLRWKNRLHRMVRVNTSTGAQRYEDMNWRLTWIGIPAKSILLDSRNQRQLANECRSAAQLRVAGAN